MSVHNFACTFKNIILKRVSEIGFTNLFLLLLLAVITLQPLFSGGFTTHDDATIAINEWSGVTWKITKLQSLGQGRFTFFWGFPLSAVPFIIDSRVWYLAWKFGAVFMLLAALYYSVLQSFKSSWIALAAIGIYLAIMQNGWEHNALTSYAFVFNFYATLFLISLGLFVKAIDQKSLALAVISGVMYFFALGSELFVLFFSFYIAVVLSRGAPEESIVKRLNSGRNYILAIFLPLVTYLAIYVVWRHLHPSNYEGMKLNAFNLLAIVKVISTYSLSAFPLASFHFYTAPGDPFGFASPSSLRSVLAELNVVHIIKPAVIGFLFAKLMTSDNFTVPKNKTLIAGAALACAGIFLPNILLGFTERHQSWVGGGTYSYVYTYYSFISMVVFLALILAYANAKSRLWHPRLRLALISFVVVATMILGFAVELRNQHFAFDQKLAHRKWQLMDVVIESHAFMDIPDGSIVVAPTLLTSTRGYAAVSADDWSNYVKYKTSKNIKFVESKRKNETESYTLVFHQPSYLDDQFIVLKKENQPGSLALNDLTIYSIPIHSKAVIIGSFIRGVDVPKLKINGEPILNIGAGIFSTLHSYKSDGGHAQIATLSGNVDISADQITLSYYEVQPRLRSLSEELADGIDFKIPSYPDFLAEVEGVSSFEPWGRWTDAAVAKLIFKQPLPRKFILEIAMGAFGPNMGAPVKLRVGNIETSFVITPKMLTEPFGFSFETDGTSNTLEITPSKPTSPNELDSENPDTRKLGVGLISIKIKIKNIK